MCQVHTGTYVPLLAPEKTRLHRLPPRKDHHVCSTRGTYHYAYARQTQIHLETEKTRKESEKGKEKKRKTEKTRRGSKERKGNEKNTVIEDLVMATE